MPKSYSDDLRKRVVEARLSGMLVREICATFSVDDNSVYSWVNRYRETGSYSSLRRGGCRPCTIAADAKFRAFAEAHVYSTLTQMAAAWDDEVSIFAISRTLKKLGITRKKRPTATVNAMT
jgi:transposase